MCRQCCFAALLTASLCTGTAFAQLGEEAPAKPKPQPDQRVQVLLDDLGMKYEIDEDGDFKLVFEVGDEGRTQIAWIRSRTEKYRDLEIREIISPGYEAKGGDFPGTVALQLLDDNRSKKFGGWQKDGNAAIFVTHLAAQVKADTLNSALIFTVEAADEMEKQLSGDKDAF